MLITKKNIVFNITIFIAYFLLSIITYLYVKDGLHLFLIWNLFLAMIPYFIALIINKDIIKNKYILFLVFLIWLIFFPNSMYIITDLIYINTENFISELGPYEPVIYLQDSVSYLAMFHIYLGGIISLGFGFKSLIIIYKKFETIKLKKYREICLLLVFFISSIAIYIGRFFRYNSWDFYKIFLILKDFFASFSTFTVFFILSYTILLAVTFKVLIMNSNNCTEEEENV